MPRGSVREFGLVWLGVSKAECRSATECLCVCLPRSAPGQINLTAAVFPSHRVRFSVSAGDRCALYACLALYAGVFTQIPGRVVLGK